MLKPYETWGCRGGCLASMAVPSSLRRPRWRRPWNMGQQRRPWNTRQQRRPWNTGHQQCQGTLLILNTRPEGGRGDSACLSGFLEGSKTMSGIDTKYPIRHQFDVFQQNLERNVPNEKNGVLVARWFAFFRQKGIYLKDPKMDSFEVSSKEKPKRCKTEISMKWLSWIFG